MIVISPISFYLGLKIERDREKKTIKLSQSAYINKVLEKHHLYKGNAVNSLIKEIESLMLSTDGKASPFKRETYQEKKDLLIFSIVETIPDSAFTIPIVSRFAKNLFHQHIEAVKTTFRYLKGSKDSGITYRG